MTDREKTCMREAYQIYSELDDWASMAMSREFREREYQNISRRERYKSDTCWKDDHQFASQKVSDDAGFRRNDVLREYNDKLDKVKTCSHDLEIDRHVLFRDQRGEDLEMRRDFQSKLEDNNYKYACSLSQYSSPRRNPTGPISPRSSSPRATSAMSSPSSHRHRAPGAAPFHSLQPHAPRSVNRFVLHPDNDMDRMASRNFMSLHGKPPQTLRAPRGASHIFIEQQLHPSGAVTKADLDFNRAMRQFQQAEEEKAMEMGEKKNWDGVRDEPQRLHTEAGKQNGRQ